VAGGERSPYDVKARELVARARTLYTCSPDDDVLSALRLMREKRVRRLPVVDAEGRLEGILSLTDAVLCASRGELSAKEVLAALETISRAPSRVIDDAELHA